ncbi:MAG: Nramp family divalent metal transporter [Planctomycetaceae bacterium]|nr:Nramp family divalent metal transporter [Planctomycetaceae bacterium]
MPPLKYRDLPEPIAWTKMVGPSIMLAGLALGSGEFILWPRIAYASGFVFFWAALLGMITQFFVNMEIERWTLATGESALAGFSRLSWHWSWIFLILNIVPWAWPGWGTGAAQMGSWLIFGPVETIADGHTNYGAYYVQPLAIALLLLCGVVLTSGPVVYNTVERMQTFLVGLILVLVAIIAVATVRWDAFAALFNQLWRVGGLPDPIATGLPMVDLLGAVAFAGAGGSLNLGQSNYIMDKGYGMGQYIGRITSPLTGKEEPIPETGFHFRHTPENMRRWHGWWRAANIEHFISFLVTCIVTLFLLSLITYSLLYNEHGQLNESAKNLGGGMNFVWVQAQMLGERPFGAFLKTAYLLAGVAILFTTELGVLDAGSRISADIVKTNFLRTNERWSIGRLYFVFLWAEIALGSTILILFTKEPLLQLRIAAAMNGAVMFLFSLTLLYMNNKILSRRLSMSPLRFVMVVWSCGFYGYFTIQAVRLSLLPLLFGK